MYVLEWVWQFFQFYALYLVLIAVHEAGHQLAGALVGYRWKGWIVGPLQVSRADGRVRVSLSKMPFSGRAMAFPHPKDTRARRVVRIVGGPFASLLLGLGLLLYFLHLTPVRQGGAGLIMTAVLTSFWLVLCSIVPYSRKDFKNDAALLVQLWEDKDKWADIYVKRADYELEKPRYDALTLLAASMQNGQRPREWDGSLVEQANVLRDGKPNEAMAAHYGFYWAADREDWEACGNYIGRALTLRETLPDVFRAMVLLDGAYHAGLIRSDAVAARLLLAEASDIAAGEGEMQAMLRSMTLRAEAATLRAEGKPEEAVQKAQEALDSLSLVGTSDCADRFLIERLLVPSPAL